MKQLQNNFTTPEQSKRLLELGVPADSTDCCFYLNTNYSDKPHILYKKLSEKQADYDSPFSSIKATLYPCWSVGQLMEIIDICALGENSDPNTEEYPSTIKVMNKLHIPYVEYLVKSIERAVQLGTIDFSKLED